jgi:hypothetical protein
MNLYTYCLSHAVESRTLEGLVGIAGANPYVIEHEGIVLVASDFNGENVGLSRDNVFAHARVIDQVLAQTTPLPYRFGTVVSRTRLESYIHSHNDSLQNLLTRVQGCVEMSVKIVWDVNGIRESEAAVAVPERRENAERKAPCTKGAGTAFLLAKQGRMREEDRLRYRADEIASWLGTHLSPVVQESAVRVHPAEALVVAASYLVKRNNLPEYRKCLEHAREEQNDLRFMMSGPWPPYNFSNLPT